ncbi:MAG: hypothetical protein HDQ96_06660 [Lachnospiraceae bacterium]|nr:hypothetical protein [Lachnospiraceae bacterium]
MKQIIGYIEYDYMNIKYGMFYMLAIFGIVGVIFSMQTGTGAVAYMLFGGLVLAGSVFNTTMQTVSFTALAPGSVLQKVTGRYLGGVLCIIVSIAIGLVATVAARLADMFGVISVADNRIEVPVLLSLFGISLFFVATQNVLLYLLTPLVGIQLVSAIRMVPGFVMFFGVMNLVREDGLDIISMIMQNPWLTAGIILGIGILSIVIAIFLSCLIIRNRDNV